MKDSEIMKSVNVCANFIKSINKRKSLIQKDKTEKMELLSHDLKLIAKHKDDVDSLDLSAFKSIKVSLNDGCDKIKKETLIEIETLLQRNKDLLEEKYDQMTHTLDKALIDYKKELKTKNLDIFHNVAEIMVDTFHY